MTTTTMATTTATTTTATATGVTTTTTTTAATFFFFDNQFARANFLREIIYFNLITSASHKDLSKTKSVNEAF